MRNTSRTRLLAAGAAGAAMAPAGHDIDLYFMDASCVVIGAQATSAANESGVIPGGAAYVLTQLWTGADVPFTLTAVDAG